MLPTISLSTLLTDIGSVGNTVLANITPFIVVGVGVPLAFYVVKQAVSLARARVSAK